MPRKRKNQPARYIDHPPGAISIGRGLLRRTDLFDGLYTDDTTEERDLYFWSDQAEPIYLSVDWPLSLGGADLALLAALVAWATPDHYVRRRRPDGGQELYVAGTPHQIAQVIYGARTIRGEEYAMLGLTSEQLTNPSAPRGALQRLSAVRILARSQWLAPSGQIEDITENFALIPHWVYRRSSRSSREMLYYQIGEPLLATPQPVPSELLRTLGPKDTSGLRLALHVLSHAPIIGRRREIGLNRLVQVVRPPESRHPGRYPGRYRRYVEGVVGRIDRADPHHHWAVADAPNDPSGKLVVEAGS